MSVTANKQPESMPEATEQNANIHEVDNASEHVQHAATQSEASDPVQSAASKLHAVLDVLRGVQEMRYDRTHAALREAMRQTALAAIEDAITDLYEAQK